MLKKKALQEIEEKINSTEFINRSFEGVLGATPTILSYHSVNSAILL